MRRSKFTEEQIAFVLMRIRDIASARVCCGFRRVHVLLGREGWRVNHKRVYRPYCIEGLNLHMKGKKKRFRAVPRPDRPRVTKPNESWSMDFVADALFNGRRFKCLTIVDSFSRECLAIETDHGICGEQVVEVPEGLKAVRGITEVIRVDNGSEFVSKAMDK
jgi:putative transposase